MDISSVNTQNVAVSVNGTEVKGTISTADAEFNLEQTKQYARTFIFTPNSNISGETSISVKNAVNYAGTSMTAEYNTVKTVEVQPKSISVSEISEIEYGTGEVLELQIVPEEAGANKKLTVVSSSPSIVSVANGTVTTDDKGKAVIVLNGNLPGSGIITISLDDTQLSTSLTATVGNIQINSTQCAKVTANIPSGTEVEKGTQIILSTSTEGAEIYYTLDGKNPAESDMTVKYTGPITIDEDTMIIAYAAMDGYENSSNAYFLYTIAQQPTPSPTTQPTESPAPTCTPTEEPNPEDKSVPVRITEERVTDYVNPDGSVSPEAIKLDIAPAYDGAEIPEEKCVIIAYYDSGKQLKKIDTGINCPIYLKSEDFANGTSVKVFVFDSITGMKPLAKAYSRNEF